jgi:uncharacterized protein (TIGR00730 family)
MSERRVCVYCASSRSVDQAYFAAAAGLGRLLAEAGFTVVTGAGSVGLMGELADHALAAGGQVEGVIPRFMMELEWAHPRLSRIQVVEDLHARKRALLAGTDAVIALPGGTGTLDELLEAISLKRLGLYLRPIVILNVAGYFRPLLEMLERCVDQRFMAARHREMWSVVERPAEVLEAIASAPGWDASAIEFAGV